VEDLTPVALVTGGGTGIGAAVASRLAREGYRVAVCGRRPGPLEAVAERIDGLALAVDVGHEEGARRCVEETVQAFGRLDAVVLNAGIVRAGAVADMELSDWDATMRINLTAPFLIARSALPHLRRRGGAIVSVASVSALRAGPALGAYAASKAGLSLLTQTIAIENAADGIRANVVCPGWTRTSMADEEMDALAAELGTDREGAYARVTSLVPQRRAADAGEVADVIAWLVSPAASYVNGAVIPIDGGSTMLDLGTVAFAGT
jgi:meso-butanediol dehydrogenase/(S,S)-butanediol dehydrogenase/diacetyl reductase